MALPLYLQSAVDTAKSGVIWGGVLVIAVMVAKFAFEKFINDKIKDKKRKQKAEDAAIRREDENFRRRNKRR